MTGSLVQISRSDGGLPKRAVSGPIMVTPEGIEGDRCRDLKYHGGPSKAVLMISAELVDRLAYQGYPVFYGALGENLTVAGLDPHLWRSGQRYRIGDDAMIELTSLRTPCSNLHVYGPAIKSELFDRLCKAGDVRSNVWAHGGFYARVIRSGLLHTGAPVILETDIA